MSTMKEEEYVSFYNPVCKATSYTGSSGTLATAGKPVTTRMPEILETSQQQN
jgi:hypothetical protein